MLRVVEPIVGSPFRSYQFTKQDGSEDVKTLCFDIDKFLRRFGTDKAPISVKILCELKGYKVEDFNGCAKEILGAERVTEYVTLFEKMKAHSLSYRIAKINVDHYDSRMLFPDELVKAFYNKKCELIAEIYEKIRDDDLEKFYFDFYKTIVDLYIIGRMSVHIDTEELKKFDNGHAVVLQKEMPEGAEEVCLQFNPVGAKTGRLTCKKQTFNIFTLPKDMRSVITARSEYKIVQYDFKAFQPRIAIACTEDEELIKECSEVQDIYSLMPGEREKNKLEFLQWLFAADFHSRFSNRFKSISVLRDQLWEFAKENGRVFNYFERPLYYHGEEKNVLFQNYITSNEADAVFGILHVLRNKLKSTKSRILFPFHDAIVCEIHQSESYLIEEIKTMMQTMYLHEKLRFFFPVSVKKGDDFASLV